MTSNIDDTIAETLTDKYGDTSPNNRLNWRNSRSGVHVACINTERSPLLDNSEAGKECVGDSNNKISYRLFFLGPVLFIMIFNFTINTLIIVQYVYGFITIEKFPETFYNFSNGGFCTANESFQSYLDQQEVQKGASRYGIYSNLSSGIPAIIANIAFAALSDKYGRKLFICISAAGNFISTVLITLAIYLKWNIYFLLPIICFGGMTGGWVASLSVGFAAVADVTKKGKSRVFAIVSCEIAVGLGSLVGTFSSGYLIDNLGYFHGMMVGSGIACVGFISSIILSETLQKQHAQGNSTMQTLQNIFLFYTKYTTGDGKTWRFWTCLCGLLFVFFANFGRINVETLYQLNSPFCWSAITVGWYNTLRNGVPLVFGLFLIHPFQKCMDNYTIALLGLLSSLAGYILEGFASNAFLMVLVASISFLGVLPIPIIRAVMSQMAPPEKQGSMFAGIAAIESISLVVGGVATGAIYAATVEWFRGFVFLLFAGYNVIAVVLVIILLIASYRDK